MIDEKMFINLQSYKIGLLRSLIIQIVNDPDKVDANAVNERLLYIDSITIQAIKDGKIKL